jgi:hypothetical protein
MPIFWQSPIDVFLTHWRGRGGMLRETSIYVLTRPVEDAPDS